MIITFKPLHLMPLVTDGGGESGGGNLSVATPVNFVATVPTFNYDLSQIGVATAKGNKASDVQSAYQTFITGIPTGKGGQYAVSAQQKYGYASIQDAAAAYLDAAGLPRVAQAVSSAPTSTPVSDTLTDTVKNLQDTVTNLQNSLTTPQTNTSDPFQQLIDVLPQLFGNAVYNPPLQTQATGYTPVDTSNYPGVVTSAPSGATSNIGTFIIIGVVAFVAYYLYKRYKG
ncbi:MAG TPA: hypothetical protein VH815_04495 [Acidobacteriota bacterium]|jgi:hypothetical protein